MWHWCEKIEEESFVYKLQSAGDRALQGVLKSWSLITGVFGMDAEISLMGSVESLQGLDSLHFCPSEAQNRGGVNNDRELQRSPTVS